MSIAVWLARLAIADLKARGLAGGTLPAEQLEAAQVLADALRDPAQAPPQIRPDTLPVTTVTMEELKLATQRGERQVRRYLAAAGITSLGTDASGRPLYPADALERVRARTDP